MLLSILSLAVHQIRHSTSKTSPVLGRSNTSFHFMAFAPFSLPPLRPPPLLYPTLVSPIGLGFAVFFSVSARVPWVIISTHKSNVECQLLPSSLTHSHSAHSVYRTITRSGREILYVISKSWSFVKCITCS